jgi:hypothetical protein
MTDLSEPRYGEPNWALISRWMALSPDSDPPFLAVNLMRYRALAEYADGRPTSLSGREADDTYAPLGPLAAVGAEPVFFADVLEQPAGEPVFERVAIVRYPSRAKFFEMQRREDFQELHEHKDAGMEFTIVFAADHAGEVRSSGGDGALVLRLRRLRPGGVPGAPVEGVEPIMRLWVEGVIIGDERTWDEARIDRVTLDSLPSLAADEEVEEQILTVLAPPGLDSLTDR